MNFLQPILGELIVGVVLLIFAWAFGTWAKRLDNIAKMGDKIMVELKGLSKEFHEHRIQTENRVTKVETEVENLRNNRKG